MTWGNQWDFGDLGKSGELVRVGFRVQGSGLVGFSEVFRVWVWGFIRFGA